MIDRKFVRVTWHDAQDEGRTWVPAEDIDAFTAELVEVLSWGWLVGITKKYITLAADGIVEADGVTYGRVTKIPRKMIVQIEEFKQT